MTDTACPTKRAFISAGTKFTATAAPWRGGLTARARRRRVARRGRDHPRRHGPGDDRRARTRHPHGRYDLDQILLTISDQAEAKVLKSPDAEMMGDGTGILIIDDLVDSGKTLEVVRDLSQRTFCHRLCQTQRPTAGRHLHHRGQPGHMDLLPVGYGAAICRTLPRHGLPSRPIIPAERHALAHIRRHAAMTLAPHRHHLCPSCDGGAPLAGWCEFPPTGR